MASASAEFGFSLNGTPAVDRFTRKYRMLRADILQDVSNQDVSNDASRDVDDFVFPPTDRGEIAGGFVQGIGWLTPGELPRDAEGGVATACASACKSAYRKLPLWPEMPGVFEAESPERASGPVVVMGGKAAGEPPLTLAFSVREAFHAALAACSGGSHVIPLNSPATPECVFYAICAVRGEPV